ncbi:MAG TPA: DUF58 domain-containing protein [Thermoanaerobaculia bacterium]|nr:DUF58 domain-containing protein [Thermoanaerobaculia bacterium]
MNDSRREAIAAGERAGAGYLLEAPRTMLAGAGGARVSRRAGGSLEFRDHRDYEPGDDLRHLDWNVLARSDRLAVKQFHEEISPFVDLIIDGSRSTALEGTRKAEATLSIAALIAAAARNSSFPYALWTAGERLERGNWDHLEFDFAGSPAGALVSGAASLRPLSMRVVISDFLWPAEPHVILGALAHGASAVILVQVMAASDAQPDLRGGWRLVDVETGEWREIFFDAGAESRYRDALARHRALWEEAARNVRAVLVRGIAEEIERELLFPELASAEILRPAWF